MEAHAALAGERRPSSRRRAGCSITPRVRSRSRPWRCVPPTPPCAPAIRRRPRISWSRATNAHPTHLVVQRTLAELCERTSDFVGRCRSMGSGGHAERSPEHQVDANHRASVIWLDQVKDAVARARGARGRGANRHHPPRRLSRGCKASTSRPAIAKRWRRCSRASLASVSDPNERIELEIVRGPNARRDRRRSGRQARPRLRARSEPRSRRRARAFADICAREEDWTGAEQALIRLVRLVPDAEDAGRDLHAARRALRRAPTQPRARRARVPRGPPTRTRMTNTRKSGWSTSTGATGDGAKGVEVQQALLAAADGPEMKRRRTIELANIYEQVADDPKKARSSPRNGAQGVPDRRRAARRGRRVLQAAEPAARGASAARSRSRRRAPRARPPGAST